MKIPFAIIAAAALAFPATAGAQAFPTKPLRLVVTYPAGGGADLMARLVAPRMAEALGQPGTLLLDASSYAVNPSLYEKLPYDPARAFTPIAVIALFPNMLVVAPGFAAKDVQELIAMARAKPGTIAFASSGNGSAQHLAGELFRQRAVVDITHIPYKGGAPALNDVIGGQVPMFFANMASGLPHVKSGRLRALAITGSKRSPALPDAPTIAEAGVPGYEVYEWNAIFAPAATPPAVIARIADAIAKAMQSPELRERLASLGGEPTGFGPAEADRFVRAQTELWGKVVRDGRIKVE